MLQLKQAQQRQPYELLQIVIHIKVLFHHIPNTKNQADYEGSILHALSLGQPLF